MSKFLLILICWVQLLGFQQQWRYLFIVKPPRWINRHDQTGHDTNEHSIKGGAYGHTAQRKPEFSKRLRRVSPVTNTKHMGHGIEQSPAVLFSRRPVLKENEKTVCHFQQMTCSHSSHSSVGRASHRLSRGHGFKPRWSPEYIYFFSDFFTQSHKLRSLRRSFLHFQYVTFYRNSRAFKIPRRRRPRKRRLKSEFAFF